MCVAKNFVYKFFAMTTIFAKMAEFEEKIYLSVTDEYTFPQIQPF